MINWFKKSKKEEDPADTIDATITEMEGSIRISIASLNQLARSYKDTQDKAASLQYEAHSMGKDAIKAVKQGREEEARHILANKVDAEQQGKQYQQIAMEMELSIRKLEKQVSKMKVQLDETKSKRAVLVAEFANAKTQKDINQKLQELNIRTDAFEENIIQLQIEGNLNDSPEDSLLKEFAALETSDSSIENIRKQAQEEEEKQKLLAEKNKQKQIELLFGKDFVTKKEEIKPIDKTKTLDAFFAEEAIEPIDKTKTLDTFFEKEKPNLHNFFEQHSTPPPAPNNKMEVDFFFSVKQSEEKPLEELFDGENQLCIDVDSFFKDNRKQEIAVFFDEEDNKTLLELEKKMFEQFKEEKNKDQKINDFFGENHDKKKQIDDFFNS